MRTVIIGGTSHIARALTPFFREKGDELCLFARRPEALKGLDVRVESDFSLLPETDYDLLINCIGAGTPNLIRKDPHLWFSVLERFDNLALESLARKNPEALYVHFSSGAVYDRDAGAPVGEESFKTVFPNRLTMEQWYPVVQLYAEAKHRSLPALRILDLRIFSFFSRFIDPDSGYFMTELIKALVEKRPFATTRQEIVRDFPAPADLAALIRRAAGLPGLNTAVDIRSAKSVSKSEILRCFAEKFSLRCEYTDLRESSPNGDSEIYFSDSRRAEEITGAVPRFTSLETLVTETEALLASR